MAISETAPISFVSRRISGAAIVPVEIRTAPPSSRTIDSYFAFA